MSGPVSHNFRFAIYTSNCCVSYSPNLLTYLLTTQLAQLAQWAHLAQVKQWAQLAQWAQLVQLAQWAQLDQLAQWRWSCSSSSSDFNTTELSELVWEENVTGKLAIICKIDLHLQ